MRHRLVALLQLVTTDRQLAALDARTASKMVDVRSGEVAHETMRGELRVASMFAAWCVKRGWLAFDPFAGIELKAPPGGRSIGKPQLRVDEARRFLAFVVADASPEATGVLMALLMGMRARAHEIVERTARDLDDGRLLWIPQSKTRAGIRQIAVLPVLRSRLAELAVGEAPDAKLFGDISRHALHYHAVRLAKLAGVPRVTPHGLRGSFATLAVAASLPGMTADRAPTVAEVARTLGHADNRATMRRHYMAPGAEESAASARVGELLGLPGVGVGGLGENKPAVESEIGPAGAPSWN